MLGIQLSFAQTSLHPSKYLFLENDFGPSWVLDVIEIHPINDELKSYGIENNAYQNFAYFNEDEGSFLGAIRIIEFPTFGNAQSYYNHLVTANVDATFSEPGSSYLNQNANCKLVELSTFSDNPNSEEFWYLFCLKFPYLLQFTLEQKSDFEKGEFDSTIMGTILEELAAKILKKMDDQSEITSIGEGKIPEWVKNTMKWYIEGKVSEDEMINALKFLIKEGIIQV